MPESPLNTVQYRQPILSRAEADHRMMLLAELQTSLAGLGVRSVLARHHRLVLQYNRVPSGPSGITDPELHIFASAATDIATTEAAHTASPAAGNAQPATRPQRPP